MVTGAEGPISLWDATAEEHPPEASALPDRVDLAIVGGGYTGLSTALHAAQAGLSAHVVEAHEIGHGGSGRNVGLVNAGVWMPPAQVRAALGPDYGPRFLRRFADGPALVFDLIERHQIRCEATRGGTIHAAHGPSGLRDLEGRCREWTGMGEPVEMLDAAATATALGTDRYVGGLLDHRAGTVNPMGYCRGLARAARAAGAGISTGVRVTGLHKQSGGWRVETDHGAISARAVVLGTNAYTDTLVPGLKSTFTMIHYFQFATQPLGPEADHILPGRQGVWDTAPVMTSIRRDARGRLIIGSMGRVIGTREKGLSRRWADQTLKRLYPTLGPVEFDEAWHGQIAMTPDHLPRIHVLDEGLYTPIGYNGRGIITGTIFGQTMADLLTGMDPADLPLPVTDPKGVATAPVMTRLYALSFAANQFIKGL
ncbi:NAD(P)/FAD-dependent oxidoreductase [Roseicyclus mahoneyensis]|uniref:Glycine/D-amino acid oxidase-like deaminating enzyme n=1 Tax=Roseicyclus mahoneyensis TaxID=164332 RepID=A0A316G9J1_9RHOB|nr:FAD-binding oxidoreductase [Roseicyclus mahoneyensis]PWK57292.1 glycine/D-amino acid oxidase-like deaminating enzyme [Roseicyclus mahoneyensis]